MWSWLGQWFDERGLLAIYRSVFFYGVCRMIAWTTWAHVVAEPVINGVKHHGYPFDLSWTGPWWVQHVTLPHTSRRGSCSRRRCSCSVAVYFVANTVWERMESGSIKAIAWRNVRRKTG